MRYHSNTLTARELEVIELLSKGYANKEIAHFLGIALRTVEVHLSVSYQKLGANGRADAVTKALRAGWIKLK